MPEPDKRVRRRAILEVIEYKDGTAAIFPRYEPEFDANSGAHVLISSVYVDVNNHLTQQGVIKNAEESSGE